MWVYFRNIAIAVDHLGNAILFGSPTQTISARCYEAAVINKKAGWWIPYRLINAGAFTLRWTVGQALGFHFGADAMTTDHCKDSYEFPGV